MFEDSKKTIEKYQLDMLHEFLEIIAPPSMCRYGELAQSISNGGKSGNPGHVRSVGRVGEDSFGPNDMDVSMIVDLLVGANDEGRKLLAIRKPGPRIKQELFNIRNDRNDLQAHRGSDSDFASLCGSCVIAEHLMRFLLALKDDTPHVVSSESMSGYLDKWFVTLRHFLDGLETELTDFNDARKPERWAKEMMDRVLSRMGEERDQEYTTCWLELHDRGNRIDRYGHPRPEIEQKAAQEATVLFDRLAAEAGIKTAQDHLRDAALCRWGDSPWFHHTDYADRAAALIKYSKSDGLKLEEKLCLSGLLMNGLFPTHPAEEGARLLEECKEELAEGERIEPYETDEGYTFYRFA